MAGAKNYDVVVVGAGVFGAWTALALALRGKRVALLEAYGPGHSRSSSGDESRIIRMGYGGDEIYTRWSRRSLHLWKELFAAVRDEPLFEETGVLWLAEAGNASLAATREVLTRCEVKFTELGSAELSKKYPQINFAGIENAIYEPESGVLMARRSVAAVVAVGRKTGVEYQTAQALGPKGSREISHLETSAGKTFAASQFVFACGAWLGKLFPDVLGERIFPTRQAVFYIGVPAGDERFSPPELPTFLFKSDESYGMPNLESRGLKIALDRHGEPVDPDTQSRVVTASELERIRNYVAYRFPALADAPVVETRVCQYENTSSGDFLVDRHPDMPNVWLVGGGSGHGFKHGPALGEYVAARLSAAAGEPRFSLESKATVQSRTVF
jgi:monomeric sarcosine oxidase